MNSEYIRDLFACHYWRIRKILSKAALIQPWQFDAPTTFPHVSLRGTLVHLMGAEWVWYQRACKGVSPTASLSKDEFPTLQSIADRWATLETDWLAWLQTITDEDMKSTCTYSMLGGGNRPSATDPVWVPLTQVVNHGMQHSAEMAQMLTDYGQSPGNIDFLIYWREKK